MPLVSRGGTSTVISCIYFGIILSVSRFGANMGNEEDELPEEDETEGAGAAPSHHGGRNLQLGARHTA